MIKKELKTSLLLFGLSFAIRLLYFVEVKGIDAQIHGDEGGYLALGNLFLGLPPIIFIFFVPHYLVLCLRHFSYSLIHHLYSSIS